MHLCSLKGTLVDFGHLYLESSVMSSLCESASCRCHRIPEEDNSQEERLTFAHSFKGFSPKSLDPIPVGLGQGSKSRWQLVAGQNCSSHGSQERGRGRVPTHPSRSPPIELLPPIYPTSKVSSPSQDLCLLGILPSACKSWGTFQIHTIAGSLQFSGSSGLRWTPKWAMSRTLRSTTSPSSNSPWT